MSQSHLTIDFPIKEPANAKALTKELPSLMPDFAKTQDQLGTVHYSRFMVKGDEKLLFLSDIDGEVDEHIERLVKSAGPVFDAILTHVDDPPATPVADNPPGGRQMAQASGPRASRYVFRLRGRVGSGHQGVSRVRRASRAKPHRAAADIHALQVACASHVMKLSRRPCLERRDIIASDAIGTLHFPIGCPLRRTTTWASSQSSTVPWEQYIHDFATKPRSCWIRSFHMSLARRHPSRKGRPRRSSVFGWKTTIRLSGFTAPIQVSRFKTFEP